jgi:hypothetical protein
MPRKNHYAPEFLLKGWCNPQNGKLTIYQQRDGRVVTSERTPEYTAFEYDLYSYADVPPEKREALETDFMTPHIDTPAATILKKIIELGTTELTANERSIFTRFILSLRLRHPDAIATAQSEGHAELKAAAARMGRRQAIDPPTVQNFGLSVIPNAITDQKIGERIYTMSWWVVDIRHANTDLLIADRPCLLEGNAVKGRCIIVLPLNPVVPSGVWLELKVA